MVIQLTTASYIYNSLAQYSYQVKFTQVSESLKLERRNLCVILKMCRQLLDLIHYLNLEIPSREQKDGNNLTKYFLDNDVYFPVKAEGNQKGNTQSEENP